MKHQAKIVSIPFLIGVVKRLRREGKIIVTANGVFDVLHPGHVRALFEAKEQGDVLIVGINADLPVRRLKGPSRPVQCEKNRSEVVAGLSCVDYVFVFSGNTPIPALRRIRPDVHANSPEYGVNCVERRVVEKYGGRIFIWKKHHGFSTTRILRRARSLKS